MHRETLRCCNGVTKDSGRAAIICCEVFLSTGKRHSAQIQGEAGLVRRALARVAGQPAGRQGSSLAGLKDQAASLVGSWQSTTHSKDAYFFFPNAFKSSDSTSDIDRCCQRRGSEARETELYPAKKSKHPM